jgi:hypothetical protein|tara:strand:- start:1887 stop:2099 length:213 start_codon:yes stop_codon:yes gene_type:complete
MSRTNGYVRNRSITKWCGKRSLGFLRSEEKRLRKKGWNVFIEEESSGALNLKGTKEIQQRFRLVESKRYL